MGIRLQGSTKILLLYPPISKQERYSSAIGSAGGKQIPLGLYYLAAFLRQHQVQVRVTDAEALELDSRRILEEIRAFAPQFIGIGSTTVAFHRALEAARAIRTAFPGLPVILGGPHVSANPRQAMGHAEFDFGVLREGEHTLLELLQSIIGHADLSAVKGIAFRDPAGRLCVTPPRGFIHDLDSLPYPAYDLIPDLQPYTPPPSNYRTLPVINMITSRGCPSQCTFCDNSIFGRKYRQRSAENIVGEIEQVRREYGIQEIAFVDDTFLIDKKRIYRLFELLDRRGIAFSWTCMSRINDTDYEFLKFLKSMGCWHVSFGIESGDDDILKAIKKNISLRQAEQVIGWCNELGIRTKGFFIIGHPGETLETINKTIRLACRLRLDDIVATLNTPIPGSQQYAEVDRHGSIDRTNWAEFNYWRPVFVPEGLTRDILLKKHREIYRRFYLRPRILWRYLGSFLGRGGGRRLWSVLRASRFMFPSLNTVHLSNRTR